MSTNPTRTNWNSPSAADTVSVETKIVRPASEGARGDSDDIAKILGPALRMPGALRRGSVYVVGISRFREKLAANWERYCARIYEAIEHTIEDKLGPRDVYVRAGDESYVLSFDDVDPAQSAIKAALIARMIKEKLFGQSDIEAELHLLGEEALAAARDRAASAAEEAAASGGGGQNKAVDCEFMYFPTWDALNKVLSTYVCMPTMRQRSGRIRVGSEQLPYDATEIDWAELDARTVEYATDVVDELVRNQFAVFTLVHCNYKALESARGRDIYLTACRKIPEHLRKYMLVQVTGADVNVPTSTLTERVGVLKPYFRFAGLQIQSLDQPIERFAFMGLNHVCYRLDPSVPVDFKKIAALVRAARTARLLVAIERIRDLATADKIANLGAAFLTGPFLGDALEMPANMMRCTLAELGKRRLI